MKNVKIPTCMNPFVVYVNGKKYSYPAGKYVNVPDDVALIIAQHRNAHTTEPQQAEPPFFFQETPDTWTEDQEHPGCYYSMVGDEKEWLNPPMVTGEEYRTTERSSVIWGRNMPVYTKLVYIGYGPVEGATKGKTIEHGIVPIRVIAVTHHVDSADESEVLPYRTQSQDLVANAYFDIAHNGGVSVMALTGNFDNVQIYAQVFYVKP